MASYTGRSNRFTSSIGDYYPMSQFEQLSHRVSHRKSRRNNAPVSPREEIYLSLLKEIRSNETPKVGALVKKASGILRLSHLKTNAVPSSQNNNSTSKAENPSDIVRKSNSKVTATQTKKKAVGSNGFHSSEVVSQLAKNGGDFSKIWDYIEASALSETKPSRTRPPSRRSNISSTSTTSRSTNASQIHNKKPPWRYFGNQKGLSITSNTSIASSVKSNMSSVAEVSSLASVNSRCKYSTTGTSDTVTEKKADYMKHVFVINGQVVTFKGQGFESFTNWFGDVGLLSSNVDGNRTSRLRRELNLSGFSNQEIRMKLYEGYKLVIEAYRSNRDKQPPMRFKETIILPKGVSVEELIMCRYESGRIIIQDMGRLKT